MSKDLTAWAIGCAMLVTSASAPAVIALAEPWQEPNSPFVLGEGYPDSPATCETVKDWIDKAPDTPDRVSFAITGELVASEWDGALAYLIMCPESGVQVMCVTYSNEGREVGDSVLFGGGYNRVDERRIMLDPCLSSRKE